MALGADDTVRSSTTTINDTMVDDNDTNTPRRPTLMIPSSTSSDADDRIARTTNSSPIPEKAPTSSTLRDVLLVATVTTTMFITVANSTAVGIALPTIGRELNLPEGDLQWLVSGFSLSSGCLLLAFGRVADLYGRKLTFIAGSAFLTAFTLACAFPSDIVALNVLRAVQGLGSAATIPAAVGILAHHFPPGRARSWAFATFSAGAPIGGVFGSVVGGILTERTAKTWRSPFYLLAGLTFLSIISAWFSVTLDHPPPGIDKRIDWFGAFFISAGLVLIVFVLGQGEFAPNRWGTPYIIALLVIGVIFVAIFLYWQHYLEKIQNDPNAPYSIWTPPPLMKMSIWRRGNGRFSAMMAIAFLEWCCFLGWSFWIQLYYQNYVGLSPLQTVVRILPMTVSGILCNIFVGIFVSRIPIVYLVVVGTAATAGACLLFALIDPSATYWAFGFPAAVIVVLGADFVFSAGTIYVAKVALPDEQSVAGGLFNTMTQLGTAVGVTVSTVVYNSIGRSLKDGEDNLASYHGAMWASFAFGVIGVIIALAFFRGVGVVGDKIPKLKVATDEESSVTQPLDEKEIKKDEIRMVTPTEKSVDVSISENAVDYSAKAGHS